MSEEKVKTRNQIGETGALFVQLPPRLKLEFKVACAEAGVSMNEVVTTLIQDAVKVLNEG